MVRWCDFSSSRFKWMNAWSVCLQALLQGLCGQHQKHTARATLLQVVVIDQLQFFVSLLQKYSQCSSLICLFSPFECLLLPCVSNLLLINWLITVDLYIKNIPTPTPPPHPPSTLCVCGSRGYYIYELLCPYLYSSCAVCDLLMPLCVLINIGAKNLQNSPLFCETRKLSPCT